MVVAAALASVPLGLSGAWMWAVFEADRQQLREFDRKVRAVVAARLDAVESGGGGVVSLTPEEVLATLAAVERQREEEISSAGRRT